MTHDDIIRMARVAGCHDNGEEFRFVELHYLERFAALVVAAERQRIAAEWDWHMYGDTEDIDIGAAIRARSNP